ncbi:MAG: zinc carboxypeptidase [Rhodothermaceae bacterium]|nr:zinc carboxypeptidase [Rhodothermaceae bacterium]MXZ57712.1 zinc carboxypeptidase [Rhodothermaceae bacterium]MYB91763.1 zinc carboxypeptidase [Rhodothermaceae bacterium]MYD68994.1 zinc carboxypeptidase [Rhodothermaceae bacterium]MYG45570.1 zinc carboxypeptidase [Rhodothermaceae bacterium]
MKFLVSFLLLTSFIYSAGAQLYSPSEFLGYEAGEDFTPHHRVTDYVRHVAETAENVVLVEYGHTYEGRVLQYLILSSADNLANLENIRTANLQLTGLLEGTPMEDIPALVWLSYNVHGNESVSTEAALEVIHTLASGTDPDVSAWLENTVVIIDPCLNPDGRDRYVHFYHRTRGRHPNVIEEAREHAEPWPGGRTNHYYFDLNRDWAWGTQMETRQRLQHYNRWMPHVHVDFHEQSVNSPYYFAPAAVPYHKDITPWQRELQDLMGANHARYFDQEGWLFFTRQVFDLFYPGYGDTWPTFNGAIGMTYEQAGSGRAGLGIITAEGDTLTLADRIEHHYTTSLSTIEVAANERDRIVDQFTQYFRNSVADATGAHAAYLIRRAGQEDQVHTISNHLDLLGITYGFAATTGRENGFAYHTGAREELQVEPGDLVVPAAQPKGVLARVLFEPEPELEDSLTYDITAWALPYVYGVEAYALDREVTWETIAPVPAASAHPSEPVAYIAEWKSFEDARLLADLLQRGVKVRYAEVPFEVNQQSYDEGTLIMTRGGAGAAFDSLVIQSARRTKQQVDAVTTTRVTEGVDFGSGDVVFIRAPRVAIVAGTPISPYSLGQLWHFFDEQLEYSATLVDSDDFGDLPLFRYDVIILPSGSYSDILDERRLEEVRDWIREGGRLIALERAAAFLADKDGFGLKRKPDDADGADSLDTEIQPYADRDRHEITQDIPGAIFRTELDTTHPLAFGYPRDYFTLKVNPRAFSWLEDGWNVGVLKENSLVAGFAGTQALEPLEQSLILGMESIGRGEVIYFADNPIFRGFYYHGRLLLANAVFLAGQRSVATF